MRFFDHPIVFNLMFSWDYDDDEWECRRLDQTNLISKFLKRPETDPLFEGKNVKFVENREQLQGLDISSTDYLLGKCQTFDSFEIFSGQDKQHSDS